MLSLPFSFKTNKNTKLKRALVVYREHYKTIVGAFTYDTKYHIQKPTFSKVCTYSSSLISFHRQCCVNSGKCQVVILTLHMSMLYATPAAMEN